MRHSGRGLAPAAPKRIAHGYNQLHAYLLTIQAALLPKSEAGQAVAYLLKNWLALTRYLEEGDLPIDNNRTERSLRGIAVGRKQLDIPGQRPLRKDHGDRRSFVNSCELNKLDPFARFCDVLARIPSQSIQKLDQLLPHAWAP